jgi:hypothetical protein
MVSWCGATETRNEDLLFSYAGRGGTEYQFGFEIGKSGVGLALSCVANGLADPVSSQSL